MFAGATLGRRFTFVRPDTSELPGSEQWIAQDQRQSLDVRVQIVTSSDPNAVRQAAVRAAQVRDVRFARVRASGRETVAGTRITYVVTEVPTGLALSTIVGRRIVSPPVAAAIVGEAARTLGVAARLGVHHGYLRPAALHIAPTGRVVISGLGTDGELATQAGLAKAPSEQADARALARLHLTLVTGLDPDEVTVGDLPTSLSLQAANLARSTIAGTGPQAVADVARAMGPADAGALRTLRTDVASLPAAPGVDLGPGPTGAALAGTSVAIAPATLALAQQLAAATTAVLTAPSLADAIRAGRLDRAAMASIADPSDDDDNAIPATAEEAAQYSARTRRVVARKSHEPLGLDTWNVIAAEQNRGTPPSVVQAVFEWLLRRRPSSVVLETAAEQARHRARREAPIRSGPVLISVFIAVTLVVTIVAWETLFTPLNPDGGQDADPLSPYPQFTFSPVPLPSPSGDE